MTKANCKDEELRIPESLKRLQEEAKRKWISGTDDLESPHPAPKCANASRTSALIASINPLKMFSNSKTERDDVANRSHAVEMPSNLTDSVELVSSTDESDNDDEPSLAEGAGISACTGTGKCRRNCNSVESNECTECLGTTHGGRRGLARQRSVRHRSVAKQDGSTRPDPTVGRARREFARSCSARKLAPARSDSARELVKRETLPKRSISSRDVTKDDGSPRSKGGRPSPPRRSRSRRETLNLVGSASSLNFDDGNISSLSLDGNASSSSLLKKEARSKGPGKARSSRDIPRRASCSRLHRKRVSASPEAKKSTGDKAESFHTDDEGVLPSALLKKEGSSRGLQASGHHGGRRSPPRKNPSSSSKESRKRDSTSPGVDRSTGDEAESLRNFARQKKMHSQRVNRAVSTKALDEAQKKTKKRAVRRNKSAEQYMQLQDPEESSKVNATWTASTHGISKSLRSSLVEHLGLGSAFRSNIAKKDALNAAAIEHGPTLCANAKAEEEAHSSQNTEIGEDHTGTGAEINSNEDASQSLMAQISFVTSTNEHSICPNEVNALNDDETVILTPEELKYWRCNCGEPNEHIFKFCGICREARNWTCALCRFGHNKCRFRYCGACSSPKVVLKIVSSLPKILPSQDSDWSSVGGTAA